jgi:hypothetical protein
VLLEYSGQSSFLNVVLPQFGGAEFRPPVAVAQHFFFISGQREERAEGAGVNQAARVLFEVQAVHEEFLNASRNDNRAMRSEQANPMPAQRLGHGTTLRSAANVCRIGVDRDGISETVSEIAHCYERAIHDRK